jgi:glycosyltransferase involved in cell wall biosynthesis
MVAARLLGINFSMTLHGSDLLLHPTYLDVKLKNCSFCLTVSEYNRNYILERYPRVQAEKITVMHLGVEVPEFNTPVVAHPRRSPAFTILAVGRLHKVKDHALLVRACAQLQTSGVPFQCLIAGGGPERKRLESLIGACGLQGRVTLLGHIARMEMNSWYEQADLVVLTSRSEGIPLVLMEAMARGKIVLAPDITGIPELVSAGKTGFLYAAGSLDDLVARLQSIYWLLETSDESGLRPSTVAGSKRLDLMRHSARAQVRNNFNRTKRLQAFGDFFLHQIAQRPESIPHEDPILQQIQLSV